MCKARISSESVSADDSKGIAFAVEIEAYDGENSPALIDRLNALIDSGPFEVHVDRTFQLEEASKAHKALTEHHLGKLALRIE